MKQKDIEYLVAKETLMRSEAYDEVTRQAAVCCEGQEGRCRRYRRSVAVCGYVLLLPLMALVSMASITYTPKPSYDTVVSNSDHEEVINTVSEILSV